MPETIRIVAFGNCQAEAVKRVLDRSLPAGHRIEFFSNNWRTGTMRPAEDVLDAIAEADVVVFQPLKESHGPLSEESVRARAATASVVAFPYLYNAGISGLCQGLPPNNLEEVQLEDALGLDVLEHGLILGEEAIVARLRDGASRKAVIDEYRAGEIDFQLHRRFDACMSELERRELATEVKLAGFIRANHTRERLFLTHSHPTTPLLLEVCRQLTRLTGLEADLDPIRELGDDNIGRLGRGIAPISPADVEAMGYEFGADRHWERFGSRLVSQIADKYAAAAAARLEVPERLDPGDAHHLIRIDEQGRL
jgi:hypothetical protein